MSQYTPEERTLLLHMAEMRADQIAWDAIAHKLGKPVAELHTLKARYPQLWKKSLREAQREWLASVNQEAMMALLHLINKPDDEKTVLKAANVYARLAHTQTKLLDDPTPKRPKVKEQSKPTAKKAEPRELPRVERELPPLPQAKLPNGTAGPPVKTAS